MLCLATLIEKVTYCALVNYLSYSTHPANLNEPFVLYANRESRPIVILFPCRLVEGIYHKPQSAYKSPTRK